MKRNRIIELPLQDINAIEQILVSSTFKPYRYIAGGIEKELTEFWLNRIINSITVNQAKVFAVVSGSKPVGFISISELPWDSKIFKIPMSSITELVIDPNQNNKYEIANALIRQAIKSAKESGYKFILCKCYSDDTINIHSLEHSGFLMVDTLLDYTVDLRKTPFNATYEQSYPEEVLIRLAKPEDEEDLIQIANDAFRNHFGRYHSEPRFTKEQAVEVYVEWIRSSISGYADYIILADINGQIAGFTMWKKATTLEESIPIRVSHYSIGAVHPDHFGKGLFTSLTYEGMRILNKTADIIEGPTHINNYPVQRGYRRLNWQISDARHSFHKWV